LTLATKLLRVLQEGQFERRLSPIRHIRVSVRVIATTNHGLSRSVGWYIRQDLYRLNVLPIPLPPLSQRAAYLLLAQHFCSRLRNCGKRAKRFG
jgi:transcriptional regulator with GAF, ATPase, and Fis domain